MTTAYRRLPMRCRGFSCNRQPQDSSICHCRIYQKAFGAYLRTLVSVRDTHSPGRAARRSVFNPPISYSAAFAALAPLTYGAGGVATPSGAFDDSALLPPVIQWSVEGKIGFIDLLHSLPKLPTQADLSASFLADLIFYQHLDHDTPR